MSAPESKMGRMLLHLVCMVRDHHWWWHWEGILRELPHGLGESALPRPVRPVSTRGRILCQNATALLSVRQAGPPADGGARSTESVSWSHSLRWFFPEINLHGRPRPLGDLAGRGQQERLAGEVLERVSARAYAAH